MLPSRRNGVLMEAKGPDRCWRISSRLSGLARRGDGAFAAGLSAAGLLGGLSAPALATSAAPDARPSAASFDRAMNVLRVRSVIEVSPWILTLTLRRQPKSVGAEGGGGQALLVEQVHDRLGCPAVTH